MLFIVKTKMKNIDLSKINPSILLGAKKVHFVGIGGIGVSAIARMMIAEDKVVSGSDTFFSTLTEGLQKIGAKIFLGHSAGNVAQDIDLIVYTPAVDFENPELKKGKKLKIPILSYPEALGLISKDKYTIAISGAHGKTTTTAMIGKILIDAELKPSIIVGSLLKDYKSNFVAGSGKYFVVEACEYKKSFLNLNPKIIVITNIDNDHLDYYKNLNNIKKAFAKFAGKLGKNDFLVCDKNDKNLLTVVKKAKCKIIDYSKIKVRFNLKIPGEHNIKNAQAATAVAKILKISPSISLKALNNFTGTWRRFEYKGKTNNGVLVYDDYAHHPTEIKATLKAAKEFFGKHKPFSKTQRKLWCVFQPHLYSRTKLLLNDFGKSFDDADEIILADIYAAREKKDKSINSEILVDKIMKNGGKAVWMKSFDDIVFFLDKNVKNGDVVIIMGAGDIFKVGEKLLNNQVVIR